VRSIFNFTSRRIINVPRANYPGEKRREEDLHLEKVFPSGRRRRSLCEKGPLAVPGEEKKKGKKMNMPRNIKLSRLHTI